MGCISSRVKFQRVIGMSVNDGMKYLTDLGYKPGIVTNDLLDADFKFGRIDIYQKDGIIYKITVEDYDRQNREYSL